MKYRYFYILLLILSVSAFSSCHNTNKGKQRIRHTVAQESVIVDSSLIVKLDNVDYHYITVTLEKTGEVRKYTYDQAQMQGQVKGSLNKGDEFSIFPDSKTASVRSIVNLTEFKGQWFYDLDQHRGMEIGHLGAISSINMEHISFRNWFIKNGRLIIHYVDMQQRAANGKDYWVDHSEIVFLSKDELDVRFRGTVLKCHHQAKVIKFKF